MFKKKIEDNEQMDANGSAASLSQSEGGSVLMEECLLAIGNMRSPKRITSTWKIKVAGDEYLGLDESMDITTVNVQGVQWAFKNVEMRNQVVKEIVAEKPFSLIGAHPCAN